MFWSKAQDVIDFVSDVTAYCLFIYIKNVCLENDLFPNFKKCRDKANTDCHTACVTGGDLKLCVCDCTVSRRF